MVSSSVVYAFYGTALIGLLPPTFAHGDEGHRVGNSSHMGGMDMPLPGAAIGGGGPFEPTYFRHVENQLWIWGHIGIMVVGWCFVLPMAVMFSVARSRYTSAAQASFLVANTLGVILALIYQAKVPDLYEHNVHRPMGWLFSWFAFAWVITGFIYKYTRKAGHHQGASTAQQISAANMERYQRLDVEATQSRRWSGDSGQGTERNSASLLGSRSGSYSGSSATEDGNRRLGDCSPDYYMEDGEAGLDESEKRSFLHGTRIDRFLSERIRKYCATKNFRAVNWVYIFFERTMLIFGWFALTSGGAVFAGVLRGSGIFNGLAHFIKGSIFFWYGCLTLGRWMGAFADFGWAWNVKPPKSLVGRFRAWVPTGEFTESFVIFLYGITNVWLEHLGNAGGPFEPQDLEHISITILFAGGGLLGMLIESTRIRDLLMTNMLLLRENDSHAYDRPTSDNWEKPNHYSVPLNPMPALVIMLLGLMMSSHHQSSMVSSMIHKMWGMLFVGFALARAVTYIIFYLKPPTSYFPSRPPSEIVASFCLCAGGLMFIASTSDIVAALEYNHLDAMFVFTVCMGLTAGIMAWETWLMALLGWAVRKEQAASFVRHASA